MKSLIMKLRNKKMVYLILPVIAGVAITLQTAFSGKLNKQVGSLETVILVHLFGLLVAVIVYILSGQANFKFMTNINLLPIMAGSMGVLIIFSISRSFVVNGAFTTIMISVVIQLIISKMIDHFGWLGAEKNPLNLPQLFSLCIIISGIVLYQYNK